MPARKKAAEGGALLTALFIMTLVAIVATAMSMRVQTDIYRTQLVINHDKLYLASQAVSAWAMGELNNPTNRFSKANAQGMVSEYPKKMAAIAPSVALNGGLYDLQARYNLNNLSEKKFILGFSNFVHQVAPDINSQETISIALAVNYWIAPYDLGLGKDNYLSYYLHQKPPYHPSHQLMYSASELRLVKEVNAPTYLALQPYITALPQTTAVNINTASKPVLMSLSHQMNDSKATEIINARGEKGLKNLDKVNEIFKKINLAPENVTLESLYFLSVAEASGENMHFTVYTLFKRNRDNKGKITTTMMQQSFNVF